MSPPRKNISPLWPSFLPLPMFNDLNKCWLIFLLNQNSTLESPNLLILPVWVNSSGFLSVIREIRSEHASVSFPKER